MWSDCDPQPRSKAGLNIRATVLTQHCMLCGSNSPLYSYCMLHALSCAGNRSDNFVVGLTNVSPLDSEPILGNYTLCGRYLGNVPLGATVMVQCDDNLPLFRYVVVHFPSTDILNVCEIQVMVKGMPEMLAASRALYSTGLVVQTPLVRFAADWLWSCWLTHSCKWQQTEPMDFELIQGVLTFVILYSSVLRTNSHVMFCRWFLQLYELNLWDISTQTGMDIRRISVMWHVSITIYR